MKKSKEKELQENLDIQIKNNVILRKMFKSEQDSNKELTKQVAFLKKENEALKQNVRKVYMEKGE